MKFETFKEIIRENVSCKMGEGYRVTLTDVRKNNGLILAGLTIRRDDTNIAPTIYLNGYYELYKNGRYTIYTAVNDIIEAYERNKERGDFNIKFFLDFETVRPRIIHKLVNTERNKELLSEVPHAKFLDMSIIFQVLVAEDDLDGMATITIRNEHCKVWGVGVDELVFSARQNTPRLLPYTAKDIKSEIRELGAELEIYDSIAGDDIVVISNAKKIGGACAMLDRKFLKECANNIGGSYYILPSSIHECLLVQADGDMAGVDDLKNMVREMNNSEVDLEDILSDSVYYFDNETGRLSVL